MKGKPGERVVNIKNKIFRFTLVMLLLGTAQGVYALSLTKDTVYESTFPLPQDSWASWHDSVSLLNSASDTAKIESILFVAPEGRVAHLEIGLRKPYQKTGYVDGIVLRSGQPYSIVSDQGKRIPPGGRVPITGFRIQECIACPVGQGNANGNSADTLAMLLVFDTGSSRDTLVILGNIDGQPSATYLNISPQRGGFKGRGGLEGLRLFNFLGRRKMPR